MFDTPMRIAMLRSLFGALLTGAVALVGFLTIDETATVRDSLLMFMGPFLSYITARGVAEGWYDGNSATQRAADKAKGV